jgi:hypothetical protein
MLTWNSKNLRNMCPSLPDRCITCKSSSSMPESKVAEVMLNAGTHLVVVAGVAGVTRGRRGGRGGRNGRGGGGRGGGGMKPSYDRKMKCYNCGSDRHVIKIAKNHVAFVVKQIIMHMIASKTQDLLSMCLLLNVMGADTRVRA